MGTVIEGSSLGAAAMRAMVGGMTLLTRAGYPVKVFANRAELARWIPTLAPDFRDAPIDSTLAQLRRPHGGGAR